MQNNYNLTYNQIDKRQNPDMPAERERSGAYQDFDFDPLVLNASIVTPPPSDSENLIYKRVSHRFKAQDIARELLPDERVSKCLRWRNSVLSGVGLNYVESVFRAHYSNLQTCNSVWMCPICAAKISERRRQELKIGVDYWVGLGYGIILVTLTMRHSKEDRLSDLLQDMGSAYRKLRAGAPWQRIEQRYGIKGSITAHEITYGLESGFHPHKHILFFLGGKLTKLEINSLWLVLNNRWQNKLSKFGRSATDAVAVDIRSGYGEIAEYVTKWGLVEEVTKSNSKSGRIIGSNYTAFQLLEVYKSGYQWAGAVYKQYARSTKGKNQLTWSPGLRTTLGLGKELTDAEVNSKIEEESIRLCNIAFAGWKVILKARARAILLEVASTGDINLVRIYLHSIGVNFDDGN